MEYKLKKISYIRGVKLLFAIGLVFGFGHMGNSCSLPLDLSTTTSVVSTPKKAKGKIILVRAWNKYKILASNNKRKPKGFVSKSPGVLLSQAHSYKVPATSLSRTYSIFFVEPAWFGNGKRGPPAYL